MARTTHPPPAPPHSASHSTSNKLQETPFFKNLASTDDTTRARAFTSLRTYLTHRAPSLITAQPTSSNTATSTSPARNGGNNNNKQEPSSETKPSLELLKLHRALLSLLWLTPHMGPQQELAREIASLGRECFLSQPEPSTDSSANRPAEPVVSGSGGGGGGGSDGGESAGNTGVRGFFEFTAAFWTVLSREWINIDSLRMDKYLWLARFMVREGLVVCAENVVWRTGRHHQPQDAREDDGEDDGEDVLELHNKTLSSTVLHPTDPRIPNGLRYHVLDVYVDELSKARDVLLEAQTTRIKTTAEDSHTNPTTQEAPTSEIEQDPQPLPPFLQTLLTPIQTLRTSSPTKTVRNRAKECLSDERLVEWGVIVSVSVGGNIGVNIGVNGSNSDEEVTGGKRKRPDEEEDDGGSSEERRRRDTEGDEDDFDGFD
ncbi:MAG: hypothetical protein M1831_005778 [Alyxoria varia]|nr:MAG: hypothetical protein M1831_005778 [Alyxoria varia]